jgi:hypothetical protein
MSQTVPIFSAPRSSPGLWRLGWAALLVGTLAVGCSESDAPAHVSGSGDNAGSAGATTLPTPHADSMDAAGAGGSAAEQTPDNGDAGGNDDFEGGGGQAAGPEDCSERLPTVEPQAATILPGLHGSRLIVDAEGNRYVAGEGFGSSSDLGGGALTGEGNLFILKLDAEGQHVWSKRLGGPYAEYISSFSFAKNGDLLVGVAKVGEWGCYAVRYGSDGTFVTEYLLDHKEPGGCPTAVLESPQGDVQLWGSFRWEVVAGETTLTNDGDWDNFVVSFSAEGTVLSARQFADPEQTLVAAAVNDEAGNTYLAQSSYVVTQGLRDDEPGRITALGPDFELLWEQTIGDDKLPGSASYLELVDGELVVSGLQAYLDEDAILLEKYIVQHRDPIDGKVTQSADYGYGGAFEPTPDGGLVMGTWPGFTHFDAAGNRLADMWFCAEWDVEASDVYYAAGALHVLLSFDGDLQLGPAFDAPDGGAAVLVMPLQ